ncbi:phage tail terminator family protein [Bacilliculturomica massiliensis]|uniref:phage tail terminator family protein n=1 Tax=Bacilliculturomica massiliensis TaxID=1917867 RepID=UPI001FE294A9|nr:hypothetical protein [Bacilliculturomica massiliensis]
MGLGSDVIDGISVCLSEEFGDEYTIYSEEIKQGLKEPCFFIFPLNPSQTPMPAARYERKNPFDIHYFPKSRYERNSEIENVADRLYTALEYITVNGDMVRGTNFHYEVVDGVLHFFVSYNLFVIRQVQKTPMEQMQEDTKMKG